MDALLRDMRFAVRGLLRTPVFTLGVALTLAIGIGANATMFGVVDELFLRAPSGVRDADRVVRIYMSRTSARFGTWNGSSISYPSYRDLRDGTAAFATAAAFYDRDIGVGRGDQAREVRASAVSHTFFPLLGVHPALGRFFDSTEDRVGGAPVVVLSYPFWTRRYDADPAILGRTIAVGRGTYTVIGVAEQGFTGINLQPVDLWLPIEVAAGVVVDAAAIGTRDWTWVETLARLTDGVGREVAAAQATAAYRGGDGIDGWDSTATAIFGPIQAARGPEVSDESKVSAWLAGVALAVLLIACANVANLLLARGMARRREFAVRAGLGSSRASLVRLLLVESLLLAALGGAGAIMLAMWGGRIIRALLLQQAGSGTGVDWRVVGFAGAAVLATTLLAGLAPAWQSSRADVSEALRSGGGHGSSRRGGRLRGALLVTQVAFTVVLLAGAGLFVRSLRNAQSRDLGLDIDHLIRVIVDMRAAGYETAAINRTYLDLVERVRATPGVEQATVSVGSPFGWSYGSSVRLPDRDSSERLPGGGPYYNAVTPEYFATMGLAIRRGRGFTAADAATPHVAVVNEHLASTLWPGRDPLGACFFIGRDSTCTTVVGLVPNAARQQVVGDTANLYYVPLAGDRSPVSAMTVRVHGRPEAMVETVRRVILDTRPGLPYVDVVPMTDVIAPQLRSWRLGATVFSAFGAVALGIAALGILAVMSYTVSQRTQEIGIRVALGAQVPAVVRLVVGQGLRAALLGVTIGVAGAYLLARAVAALLYGVTPGDPLVLGGVVAMLLGVSVAASAVPARRAARVDPVSALRAE